MMTSVPPPVHEWLVRHVASERHMAFVEVDAAGRVVGAGGELGRYGLADLAPGVAIAERCEWLLGMAPRPGAPVHLPRVSIAAPVYFDVDLFAADGDHDSTWVVLLDCSREVWHQQVAQHATHALALLRQRGDAPEAADDALWSIEVLHALELAIFIRDADGRYRVRAPAPEWLRSGWPGDVAGSGTRSRELAGFVVEAERSRGRGELPTSTWTEDGADGRTRRLEATTVRLGVGDEAIVVRLLAQE